MTNAAFVQAVPRVVVSKLHTLRIQGNKAAHGETVLPQSAVWLLQEAYELGSWMLLNYANGKKEDCPAFTPPSPGEATEAEKKLKREKTSILQLYANQEAEMESSWTTWRRLVRKPRLQRAPLPNFKPPRITARQSPTLWPSTRPQPVVA